MALSHCMAFQCANSQWMIDLYIPVLLWDEPLGRYVVSGIWDSRISENVPRWNQGVFERRLNNSVCLPTLEHPVNRFIVK